MWSTPRWPTWMAVADLEHEQDVGSPQCHRAVDVEEVDAQHAGDLCAQESPPSANGLPKRRWRDPATFEDPTDHRGADTMAELDQLTQG